jgi:hypothetical protein
MSALLSRSNFLAGLAAMPTLALVGRDDAGTTPDIPAALCGQLVAREWPQGWRVCVGWLLAILLAAVGAPVAPASAEPEPVRTTDVTFVGGGG